MDQQQPTRGREANGMQRHRRLMAELHALGNAELGGVTAEQLYRRVYGDPPAVFEASQLRREARRRQPPEWTVGRIHHLLKQLRVAGYDALADATADALHRKAWLLAAASFGRGPIKRSAAPARPRRLAPGG